MREAQHTTNGSTTLIDRDQRPSEAPERSPEGGRSESVATAVIADSDALIRDGVQCMLERGAVRTVAESDDGKSTLELVRQHQPCLLVLDVELPTLNGVDLLEQLEKASPRTRAIILSSQTAPSVVRRAMKRGAFGFVAKSAEEEELLAAVRFALQRRRYISPLIAGSLAIDEDEGTAGHEGNDKYAGPVFEVLSARERQVLQGLGEGLTSKEVGRRLHISSKTVDGHRQRIMRKLEAPSVADLIKWAIQARLVSAEPKS